MVRGKYQADDGSVHLINLSAARMAAAGAQPAGAIDDSVIAKVSKSNREYGLRPRGVTLSRTLGTAPDTFTKTSFLPVLTEAEFNSAAFAIGGSITIGTIAWEIIVKRPEDF